MVLVGIAAAAAAWHWPHGPLWRSGPHAGRLHHFSPDSRLLITTRIPFVDGWYTNPVVYRWNVETGKLLSRVEMPCGNPKCLRVVSASGDGRLALVGEGKWMDKRHLNFATGEWFLHDGLTGARKAGPIKGVAYAGRFSPDGRWFVGDFGDPDAGLEGLGESAIFSAGTGELVYDGGTGLFASDGSSVMVFNKAKEPRGSFEPRWAKVIELPSGRELRRFDLPKRSWLRFDEWDGRRLLAVIIEKDAAGKEIWRRCVVDLSGDNPGEPVDDPLAYCLRDRFTLPAGWDDGPGWLAYFTHVKPSPPPTGVGAWFERLRNWLGLSRPFADGIRANVRFVDPRTGATRYELPHPLMITILFSRDGRYVACTSDVEEGIEVWDANPSNWPKAIKAGVLASAVILAWRFWRARRRNRTAPQ
ncbi:MAG: hypothetical protein L0Y72_13605 [Gemmataceae bacterium]|nr:hypothetical protein [Gemmataceae bacterium]MCI0740076.1 hypothetical protein [Gemmataceae bacterium]